jgi:hypothetical protein
VAGRAEQVDPLLDNLPDRVDDRAEHLYDAARL